MEIGKTINFSSVITLTKWMNVENNCGTPEKQMAHEQPVVWWKKQKITLDSNKNYFVKVIYIDLFVKKMV